MLLFDPASLKVVTGIMTHRNLSRLRSVNFILFMTVLFLLRMRKITFVFHAGSWPENYGCYRKRGCIVEAVEFIYRLRVFPPNNLALETFLSLRREIFHVVDAVVLLDWTTAAYDLGLPFTPTCQLVIKKFSQSEWCMVWRALVPSFLLNVRLYRV